MRFELLLALVATTIAACARPVAPVAAQRDDDPRTSSQRELAASVETENLEAWRHASGQGRVKSTSGFASSAAQSTRGPLGPLPTPPRFSASRADRAAAYLFAAEMTRALRTRTASEWQALQKAIGHVRPHRGDREVSLAELEAILAAEPDPDVRRQWMGSATAAADALAMSLDELAESGLGRARALGLVNPRTVPAELRTVDWAYVVELARRSLRDSEALYRASLRDLAPARANVAAEALRLEDLPRLLRLEVVDATLTMERLVPIVDRTLVGLGIALETLPLRIDIGAQESVGPRALCFPIAVPQDIRIVVRPSGGLRDYQELFHEVGHGLHFVHTMSRELAFQQFGDASTAEALGILWESVVTSPTWLERFAQASPATQHEVSQVAALRRLTLMRRHAAEVLAYDEAPGKGFAEARARWTSEALGVPLGPLDRLHYLAERPWEQEAAIYLRAHLLAAQLERTLLYRFGDDWWNNPEAGKWLSELWRTGQEMSAEEVAESIGARALDPTPLLLAVAEALSPS